MLKRAKRRIVRATRCLALATTFMVFALPSLQAGVVEIQFTGMDIEYDGLVDFDITTAVADPLNAVTFLVDGVPTGTALTNNISIDMLIPGVQDIDAGGDTVLSSTGGTLDLELDTGSLSLVLGEVGITFVEIVSGFEVVFGAASAFIGSQDLPFNIALDDPITVTFSSQLDHASITDDGTFVTGFNGSGTGQVNAGGDSGIIVLPEPASMALALIAAIGVGLSTCLSKGLS